MPVGPALSAAIVGDRVLIALGVQHTTDATLLPHVTPWVLLRVAIAGLLFGLVVADIVSGSRGIYTSRRVFGSKLGSGFEAST